MCLNLQSVICFVFLRTCPPSFKYCLKKQHSVCSFNKIYYSPTATGVRHSYFYLLCFSLLSVIFIIFYCYFYGVSSTVTPKCQLFAVNIYFYFFTDRCVRIYTITGGRVFVWPKIHSLWVRHKVNNSRRMDHIVVSHSSESNIVTGRTLSQHLKRSLLFSALVRTLQRLEGCSDKGPDSPAGSG